MNRKTEFIELAVCEGFQKQKSSFGFNKTDSYLLRKYLKYPM